MGVEINTPVTTAESFERGFCNELGVNQSVRFLKNIAGLWLIQECKRQWDLDGESIDYATMTRMAEAAEPFSAFINPDDEVFASPGNMPEKIRNWCEKSGQKIPADKGTILRIATDSLALKYREVFDHIKAFTGTTFDQLHAGGGGIQNEPLSQSTADALGIMVVAGPIEATSCGNVITQMIGTGHLENFEAGRELIRRSFDFKTYEPRQSADWNAAYERFKALV
jgi:sugar (pentulose or hexulose) kinase